MSLEVSYLGVCDRVQFTVLVWCMFYNWTTSTFTNLINVKSDKKVTLLMLTLYYLSTTAPPWTAIAQTSFSLAHTTVTYPRRCLHSTFQDRQLRVGVTATKKNFIFTVQ